MKTGNPARSSAFRLSAKERDALLSAARAAARHAHCPYSRFRVGAAPGH